MWSWPATSTLLPTLLACASGRGCSLWATRASATGTSGRVHPEDPDHTFTPLNPLVTGGDNWPLELGRRIDYIMVRCGHHAPTLDVSSCERIFDEPVDRVWASDHFGVVAELSAQTWSGRPLP